MKRPPDSLFSHTGNKLSLCCAKKYWYFSLLNCSTIGGVELKAKGRETVDPVRSGKEGRKGRGRKEGKRKYKPKTQVVSNRKEPK